MTESRDRERTGALHARMTAYGVPEGGTLADRLERLLDMVDRELVRIDAARLALPPERLSDTWHFDLAGLGGYLISGMYPDTGRLGEFFVVTAKSGSVLRGMLDVISTAGSMLLQRGVDVDDLADRFAGHSFPPAGHTGDPEVGHAVSVVDMVFRRLALRHGDPRTRARWLAKEHSR